MKFLITAIVALSASAPAYADAFHGARVGIQAGIESNKIDSAELFNGSGLGSVTVDKTRKSVATVGITLGYDSVLGDSFVVGGELAGTISTGGNRQTILFSSSPTTPVSVNYKSDYTFEATLRAGFLVGENTLLYARGGYANSRLNADVTANGLAVSSVRGNNNGYVVGAGVEHAFSDNVTARIEYKHFELKGPVTREQLLVGFGYGF